MPIKLLQHKSWHVYSRDNIERVKQDEAKEEARLKAQDVQALQAQADRRLASLRTGAPEDSPVDVVSLSAGQATPPKLEKPKKRKRENDIALVDRHLDSARQSDVKEHSISLPKSDYVTEIDSAARKPTQDTFSSLERPLWYVQEGEDSAQRIGTIKEVRKVEKIKASMDPLQDMKQFLERKKAAKAERLRLTEQVVQNETVQPDRYHADKVRQRDSRHRDHYTGKNVGQKRSRHERSKYAHDS